MKPFAGTSVLILFTFLGGCGTSSPGLKYRTQSSSTSPSFQNTPIPASEQTAEASIPYRVDGTTYYPVANAQGYSKEGIASWYGPKFHGKKTSSGEVYNMHSLTAAHKTLPFDTRVRVTNKLNNRSVVVRINDRGPFVGKRIIDLSYGAGVKIDMMENGTVPVRITALSSPEPAPSATDLDKTYTVQIGVFRDLQNAQRMAQQIGDGQVIKGEQSNPPLYRVVTTAYNTFDRAQSRMDTLRREGFGEAFVIAMPDPSNITDNPMVMETEE